MIRDAGGVVPLVVLIGVVVAAAGTTLARTLLSVPAERRRVAGIRPAWAAAAGAHHHRHEPRCRSSGRSLRTIGFSLVALALFGGLFASGDALFGSWAEALVPDLGWDTIVARTFVLVLVAGVALTGAYLALNPPPVADVALPEGRRASPPLGVGRAGRHRRRPVRRRSSSPRPRPCGAATSTSSAPPA